MKSSEKEISFNTEFFTTVTSHLITWGEGKLPDMHKKILAHALTEFGVAVAGILSSCKTGLVITADDAVLVLPLHPDRTIEEARATAGNPDNSYHLFKVEEEEGKQARLYFRIAEMKRDNDKPRLVQTPAKFIQGLLRSWLRIDCARLPASLIAGAYQKAAESLNSFVALSFEGDGAGQQPEFPDISERRPDMRAFDRTSALSDLVRRQAPLEYQKARDIYPGKYAPDDKKGDRLICVSSDWISFVRTPFPGRFPLFFVNAAQGSPVRIFEKNRRLFAFLPLLTAKEGLLAPALGIKTDWWHKRQGEFTALPCSLGSWPKSGTGIMLPLGLDSAPHKESGHQGWIERYIRTSGGIGTCSIKEIRSPHPHRTGSSGDRLHEAGAPKVEWKLDLALRLETRIDARSHVIGVHLGKEPVIYWHDSQSDESGSFSDWSHQILEALKAKESLEKDQLRGRSVAHRRFFKKNLNWARTVSRYIILFAKQRDCSLAIEEITWVDKMRGSSSANMRFSMWNYAELVRQLEHCARKEGVFVTIVYDGEVKKRLARQVGRDKDKDWWRTYEESSDKIIATSVASLGAEKSAKRIEGIEKRQIEKRDSMPLR